MAGLIKIRAGIVGGAGYTGGEMIRILINHPQVELAYVHSKSNAGNPLYKVHTDLLGDTGMKFTGEFPEDIDVMFLCLGHGDSRRFLEEHAVPDHIRIIDLSQDFRLRSDASGGSRGFIYGLPELNRQRIRTAKNIANPGCFATGIQLALLPLASRGLMKSDIHIQATTGSTGAGQSLTPTSHFSWRNNNLSVYKAFGHQHLGEIGESLVQLQQDFTAPVHFIPQRGDYTRGILSAVYLESGLSQSEAAELYTEYYREHPFTHISEKNIDLKQVVNTNKCFIYLEKHGNQLFLVSVIDNLLKGASGQAVQNMNLMFGLEETAGLRLKAAAF
ncbi:MAG TPA: N-acetyl-gamma-glutamyl-phosphate reductase [Sphingobacteriaceae bacterium]